MSLDRHKLEVLAEAIARYSGYYDPASAIYLARNPLGLKAHSPLHLRDSEDRRVFLSVLAGWQAGLFDVGLKLSGQSRAHLHPADPLAALAESYGQPATAAVAWSSFLRKALHDPGINQKTLLKFFFEE